MKKHILAVSVAAALGAMVSTVSAAPVLKANGVGMVNVIPYFSTQGNNVTQISITNTDTRNAKAVKVRFRGAEWSDDIFDFTVFLSPGDVFTGAVTDNGNGVSTFSTSDGSCTLPASVNQDFPTIRLSNAATGTREGYVEVINMVDIPAGNALYDVIKHDAGVASCKTTAADQTFLESLGQHNFITSEAVTGQVMTAPTGGLTSWNRVIDTDAVKAFGVPATAYDFLATAGTAVSQSAYFQQSNDELTFTVALTEDRIFSAGPGITMYQFDMPDLSTPIDATYPTATLHRNAVADMLRKGAVMSEYSTLASVSGATDIVMTQPVRRYFYNYASGSAGTEGVDFSRMIDGAEWDVTGDSNTVYENLNLANRVPLANLTMTLPNDPAAASGPAVFWDREEQYNATSSSIVISPTPPSASYTLSLKGEASVIGLNRTGATTTGALGASLTMNDITIQGGYQTGWMLMSTRSTASGAGEDPRLPLIGFTAINVAGGNNYGTTLPLRYFQANGNLSH